MDNVGQKTLGLSRQALPSQHLEARGQVRPRVGGTPRQRPHPKPLCTPHSGPGHTSFLTVHPSFQQPQAGRTEEDSSPGPRDYSRGRCSLVLRITLHRLFRERQVLQDASASRALPIFAKTTAYAAPDGGSPPPHLPGLPPLPDGKLPLPFLSFQTWVSPLTQWKKKESGRSRGPPPGGFGPARRLGFRVTAVQTARAARAGSRAQPGGAEACPVRASSAPPPVAREIQGINTHFPFLFRGGGCALIPARASPALPPPALPPWPRPVRSAAQGSPHLSLTRPSHRSPQAVPNLHEQPPARASLQAACGGKGSFDFRMIALQSSEFPGKRGEKANAGQLSRLLPFPARWSKARTGFGHPRSRMLKLFQATVGGAHGSRPA
ncbi:PREDICTED: uncharacterized protein LOC105576565 isoform X1 [Cercocebus atys]|uniref:uncharacterized protein LOC105576565 isoform X1 n=1 Tax=Cercocebus atys TaxID=9531 RepID=UPI0005F37AEE|nr:PREDICTED: uncharacterized protein LOC105576565 isoform X1 [Cercocebus atys]